jgi:hypothetical protein
MKKGAAWSTGPVWPHITRAVWKFTRMKRRRPAKVFIRNHCRVTRQLLRWWNAALVFDDRDDGNYASIPATTNRARRTLHTHFEWSWSFSTKTTTQVVIYERRGEERGGGRPYFKAGAGAGGSSAS